MNHDLSQTIQTRLSVLPLTHIEIEDQSHLHVGHEGAKGGASHFKVLIISVAFEHLSRVARHRLVYDLLLDLMPHPIHALVLQTLTPSETTQ